MAGYIPATKLPSLNQITRVLDAIANDIQQRQYPAYVTDYRFTYWMANPATSALTGQSFENLESLMRNFTTVFQVVFDSRMGIRSHLSDINQLERDQIFRFKAYNLHRRHEKFYLSYPECMQFLSNEDYSSFYRAWHTVDVDIENATPVYPFGEFGKVVGYVQYEIDKNTKLEFNLIEQRILHLRDLFDIVWYEPIPEPRNLAICQEVFDKFKFTQHDCAKIWDLTNVKDLLGKYETGENLVYEE